MAERRLHGLQRVLGVNALFSTAYGNVGSSIYYALGLVASFALGLTPVVFVITGIIFFLTASTYAEATAMYPEAGGSSSFARRAFNEFASFFAAWAQMLNYTITIAISAFFVPHYLGGVLGVDALRHSPGDIIFAIGAVLVLSPSTLVDNVHFGIAPSWRDFLVAIPLGMIAYTGIETISNMAEEAKDETKTIPAAINRVVIAVFVIYAALPVVALSALPVTQNPQTGAYETKLGLPESAGGFSGDPILGVVKQIDLGPFQGAGELYVGLLAATILFIAANAGIIGVSRLVYSMGLYQQVPDKLRELHPKYGTPWIGILLFGAVACVFIIPGKADFLGNLYAFGAMLSFTIAHAAVIRLRLKHPDVERPYRGPFNVAIKGRDIPVFAVLGGLGTLIAFLTVTLLYLQVALAGVGWLAIGLIAYPLFRRSQGLDLLGTHKTQLPQAVVDHEAEYESVLVVFDNRAFSQGAMATANKIATRRKRGIHVIVPIVVPTSSPVDASLPDQESAATAILEQARIAGGSRVTGNYGKVRAGQTGAYIVSQAEQLGTKAIVMGLPPRSHTGAGGQQSIFGRTVETVLARRPCRVIIQSEPEPETEPDDESISARIGR